jgi:outer membrane protein assembly factor BamB
MNRRRFLIAGGSLLSTSLSGCLRSLDDPTETPTSETPNYQSVSLTSQSVHKDVDPELVTYEDGMVYVAGGGYLDGEEVVVNAVNLDSGNREWTSRVPYLEEDVLVTDDTLVVHTQADVGSSGRHHYLYGLDRATGQQQWSAEEDKLRHETFQSDTVGLNASVTGKSVVVSVTGYDSSEEFALVLCLDGRTGSVRWRQRVGREPAIHIVEDVVYMSEYRSDDQRIRALDLNTGNVERTVATMPRNRPILILDALDDTLVSNSRLIAINEGTVETTVSIRGRVHSIATNAVNDLLVMGGAQGVVSVNPDDGSIRWSGDTDREVRETPVITEEAVWVKDEAGVLYAFDATTGNSLLKWDLTSSQDATGFDVAGDQLLIGLSDTLRTFQVGYEQSGTTTTPTPYEE